MSISIYFILDNNVLQLSSLVLFFLLNPKFTQFSLS
jgi:hypothetical protein